MNLGGKSRPEVGGKSCAIHKCKDRGQREIVGIDDEPPEELGHCLNEQHPRDQGFLAVVPIQEFLSERETLYAEDRVPFLYALHRIVKEESHGPFSQGTL